MYETTGILEYDDTMRAVLWVDQALSNYYRSLIPKYYYVQPQKHKAHITVVRNNIDKVMEHEFWGRYAGEKVLIQYDGIVKFDNTYFYLDVHSDRVGDIREELGLPRIRLNLLGVSMGCYHLTIGNIKDARW